MSCMWIKIRIYNWSQLCIIWTASINLEIRILLYQQILDTIPTWKEIEETKNTKQFIYACA